MHYIDIIEYKKYHYYYYYQNDISIYPKIKKNIIKEQNLKLELGKKLARPIPN